MWRLACRRTGTPAVVRRADPYKKPDAFVVDFTGAVQVDGPGLTVPVISMQPADVSVVVGGDVELLVTASGRGLVYRWQKKVG